MINVTQFSLEELQKIRDQIENEIENRPDEWIYICEVRSYGRNWKDHPSNPISLQELCWRYDGEDGIVDVYSTNPDLKIHNYGDVRYIVSKDDYENWKAFESLKRSIEDTEEAWEEWDNRDDVPFHSRPSFEPTYTKDDLVKMKERMKNWSKPFIEPQPYQYEDC